MGRSAIKLNWLMEVAFLLCLTACLHSSLAAQAAVRLLDDEEQAVDTVKGGTPSAAPNRFEGRDTTDQARTFSTKASIGRVGSTEFEIGVVKDALELPQGSWGCEGKQCSLTITSSESYADYADAIASLGAVAVQYDVEAPIFNLAPDDVELGIIFSVLDWVKDTAVPEIQGLTDLTELKVPPRKCQ
eukprot:scaffold94618_cov34-Prasinocladus_malaysianus.AAC.3